LPFSYYSRLSARDKEIYRRSDAVATLRLARPEAIWPFVETLRLALAADVRPQVEVAAQYLARALLGMLEAPPVHLEVLAVRPTLRSAELHGLYTRGTGTPRIKLWMRTAQKKRAVAFRTFLRTLLHELMHHFDYEILRLPDSFHTEGFFKRESSLFHQLVPKRPEDGG
jgi:hypothetical protein